MRVFAILIAGSVAGCASIAGVDRAESYSARLDRLEADCAERGGILVATGQQTARPQVDNVCQITSGPAGRVPRSPR